MSKHLMQPCLFLIFSLCISLAQANLVPNGDFSQIDGDSAVGWLPQRRWEGTSHYSAIPGELTISRPDADQGAGAFRYPKLSVTGGQSYDFSCQMKADLDNPDSYAEFTVSWYDQADNRLDHNCIRCLKTSQDWTELRKVLVAPKDAVAMDLFLVMGRKGRAAFRNVAVTLAETEKTTANLLPNPDFSKLIKNYPESWEPAWRWAGKSEYRTENGCAIIERKENDNGAGAYISDPIPLRDCEFVIAGAELMTEQMGGECWIALNFRDAKDAACLSANVLRIKEDTAWQTIRKTVEVPKEAVAVRMHLVLANRGKATFRKPFLSDKLQDVDDFADTGSMILNGSFEDVDLNPEFLDCFTLVKGKAVRSSQAFHGFHSLELAPGAEIIYAYPGVVPLAVKAEDKLHFSLAAAGEGEATATLEFLDDKGTFCNRNALTNRPAGYTFVNRTQMVTVPPQATGACLRLRNSSDKPVCVDALHLGKLPFAPDEVLAIPREIDVPAAKCENFSTTTVADYNGAPSIFIDGKPMTGAIFTLSNLRRNTRKPWVTYIRKMLDHGKFPVVNIECLLTPENSSEKYTLATALDDLDVQIRTTLAEIPDARFIIWAFMEPSLAFAGQHPEGVVQLEDPTLRWEESVPPYSYGSEAWGRQCNRRLQELITELSQKEYARSIIGFSPGMGSYGENNQRHARTVGAHAPQDFSPAMTNFFRKWLLQEYGGDVAKFAAAWNRPAPFNFSQAQVPTLLQRVPKKRGAFYDTDLQRQSLDYIRCDSQVILHRVLKLCQTVKEQSENKLFTFAQFGYFTESYLHKELQLALKNPYLDGMGPAPPYINRGPGDDIMDHGSAESIRQNGKVWLFQADVRSHLADAHNWRYGRTHNEEESLAVYLRDLGHYMTTGTTPYYLNFERWFDTPRLLDLASRFNEYLTLASSYPRHSAAEIAVVADPMSLGVGMEFSYVRRIMPPMQSSLGYNRTLEWHHLAAPYDFLLLDDLLEARDLNRYKVIIFAANYAISTKQRQLVEQLLKQNQRTLVWLYAPGIYSHQDGKFQYGAQPAAISGFQLEMSDKIHDLAIKLHDGSEAGFFSREIYGGITMPDKPFILRRETFRPRLSVMPEPGVEIFGHYLEDGKPAAAKRVQKTHTDIFWGSTALNKEVLTDILRKAGVHLYSDKPAVVYANRNFLSLHTPTAGTRTLTLPSKAEIIYDLYNEKILAENTDCLELEMPVNSTCLVYFGDKTSFLERQAKVRQDLADRNGALQAAKPQFAYAPAPPPMRGKVAKTDVEHSPDHSGFIRHWRFLGPFPNTEKEPRGWDVDHFQGETASTQDFAKTYSAVFDTTGANREREAIAWFNGEKKKETLQMKWTPVEFSTGTVRALYEEIELPFSDCITYYLACYVSSDTTREALLTVGSDDGEKCWFNGKQVTSFFASSRRMLPDNEKALVTLASGRNLILLKVTQGGGGVGHAVRFLDPKTQKPIRNLRITLE